MSRVEPWWRTAAVYQVYIRSFKDGNGDGTGDIAGLRSKLPYLRDLGVDALWINPWYTSPLLDGGYDVADYRNVDPRFGDVAEAESFIAEAKEFGIRVLVDLVPNHTSWEHEWFKAALAAGPGSPERERYHFLPGSGPDGTEPPNDWRSVFGGSAWERVPDGEWYLHLFDISQPDLNWEHPEVRAEFDAILRFWLDRGAAGFRVDVAHSLVKAPGYPDTGDEANEEKLLTGSRFSRHPYWDRPEIHEIVRGWRSTLDEYPGSMMVAEAWVSDLERLANYLRPGEYHQAFDFDFLQAPWDADSMRVAIDESMEAVGGVGSIPTWVLSNHDVLRHSTRYGLPNDVDAKAWLLDGDRSLLDQALGERRARAATLLLLGLPGSVYLYQGEELGLGEVTELPTDLLDDPVWRRSSHSEKGRDGCRVPIPWSVDGDSAGFGSNGSWLPQPDGWGDRSVEAQDGRPGSMLEFYRSALRLRREHLTSDLDIEWLDGPSSETLVFQRGSGIRCIVNFGTEPAPIDGEVLLSSVTPEDGHLPTDASAWLI
jgi:alpha-glucosidase